MKKLFLSILIPLSGLLLIISCSGSNDKYDLLSKKERTALDTFCSCTQPFQEFLGRISFETKDTSYAFTMYDSMQVMIKEFTPCFFKLKDIDKKSLEDKEYEQQLLAYIKEKHLDCYKLIKGDLIKVKK